MKQIIDDAVAWLIGSGSMIGPKKYAELVKFLEDRGHNSLLSKRAATIAAQYLGFWKADGFEFPMDIPVSRDISVGDTVFGGRIVYDEYVGFSGEVKAIDGWYSGGKRHKDLVVSSDGSTDNIDSSSVWKVVWKESWKNEPASASQLDRLRRVKEAHDDDDTLFVHSILTKGEASILIDSWPHPDALGPCHYCGMDAFGWDGMDVMACSQCGGK